MVSEINPDRIARIGSRFLPHILVALTYWNFTAFQGGGILESHHVAMLLGAVEIVAWACAKVKYAQRLLVSIAVMFWIDAQTDFFLLSQSLLDSLPYTTGHLFLVIAALTTLCLVILIMIQKWAGDVFYVFTFVAFAVMTIIVAGTDLVLDGTSVSSDRKSTQSFSRDDAGSGPISSDDQPLPQVLKGKSLVHIVFDAHGSLGEDPDDSQSTAQIKTAAREVLTKRGFVIGTRTFSRYFQTHDSIPSTINFAIPEEHKYFFSDDTRIASLKLFEELSSNGYEGHIFQSTWLNFCDAEGVDYVACSTYRTESVLSMISQIPTMSDRLKIGLALYVQSFPLVRKVLDFYNRSLVSHWPAALPALSTFQAPAAPLFLMAQDILGDLRASVIENAGNRSFYFAHILMPHSPFSVDPSCSLRQPIGYWRQSTDAEAMRFGAENAPLGRDASLTDYYEQIACLYLMLENMLIAWEEAGVLDDLVIVMHGDHGSRVSLNWPSSHDTLSAINIQNDRDNFRTHLAYRIDLDKGRTDDREVGLQNWFAELFDAQLEEQYGTSVFVRDSMISTKGTALIRRPYYGLDENCVDCRTIEF